MMCGITGTPGTGKSMIADELARRGYRVVHLIDTVRPYIIGDDEERDTQVIDDERWAEEFEPVDGFVEGHFAHLLPCDRIVVLRCRPDELKSRLKKRKYRQKKIRENAEAEAMGVCLVETVESFDASAIFELDTTGRDISYCSDQIERFLKGEIAGSFGSIDWLEFIEVGQ
jgi:adenylate kinase